MQAFLSKNFPIYCLYWDSKTPPKMVVEIALEIIENQNTENLKITPSTKFIMECIYKTFWALMHYINHANLLERHQEWKINLFIIY